MTREYRGILFALVLIAAGVLMFIANLGMIRFDASFLVPLLFLAGSGAFLTTFARGGDRWWAAIPGFALLGLGILTGIELVAPSVPDEIGAASFLGSIGLGFWAIYLMHREHWWAIIPGGVMVSLAAVVALSEVLAGAGGALVLFLGLGTTFLLVYALPNPERRQTWALFPMAALYLLSGVIGFGAPWLSDYFLPVVLILVGLFVAFSTLNQHRHA